MRMGYAHVAWPKSRSRPIAQLAGRKGQNLEFACIPVRIRMIARIPKSNAPRGWIVLLNAQVQIAVRVLRRRSNARRIIRVAFPAPAEPRARMDFVCVAVTMVLVDSNVEPICPRVLAGNFAVVATLARQCVRARRNRRLTREIHAVRKGVDFALRACRRAGYESTLSE
jgi:hypothetical protein